MAQIQILFSLLTVKPQSEFFFSVRSFLLCIMSLLLIPRWQFLRKTKNKIDQKYFIIRNRLFTVFFPID